MPIIRDSAMKRTCGTMFPDFEIGCSHKDQQGCNLHPGHKGKHRFTDTMGRLVEWEDDDSCECGCNKDRDSQSCVIYKDITNSTLVKPELKDGYVKSPKMLLAYLKEGCELRQIGKNRQLTTDKYPEYYLVVPGQAWTVRVHPAHAESLEALDLVSVENCSGGEIWHSKIDLSLPALEYGN